MYYDGYYLLIITKGRHYMKDIDKRECYSLEESEERSATIESRQELSESYKKWTTDLWMKVIQRAIEDAALAKSARDCDEEVLGEMAEWEDSALNFLFNNDHKIPFDDYKVQIICPKCKHSWTDAMSIVSAEPSICTECRYKISTKYIEYRITNEEVKSEISLAELISLWGVNDIEGFRDGCWDRIEELSQRRKPKKKQVEEPTIIDQLTDNIGQYKLDNQLESLEKAAKLLIKLIDERKKNES